MLPARTSRAPIGVETHELACDPHAGIRHIPLWRLMSISPGRFDLGFPTLFGANVARVHPNVGALGLQVSCETGDKFQVSRLWLTKAVYGAMATTCSNLNSSRGTNLQSVLRRLDLGSFAPDNAEDLPWSALTANHGYAPHGAKTAALTVQIMHRVVSPVVDRYDYELG